MPPVPGAASPHVFTLRDIPDMDRITPALDGLEAAFRPLVKTIPHDVEPALIFRAAPEEPAEEQ